MHKDEPDFIAQNGETLTADQARAWWHNRASEAHSAGATLMRYSIHPDIPHLILFEAWINPPKDFDQGEPRWQFAARTQESSK